MLDKSKLTKAYPLGRIYAQGRSYLILSQGASDKWQSLFFAIPEQSPTGEDAVVFVEGMAVYPRARDLSIIGHFIIEWGNCGDAIHCLPYICIPERTEENEDGD